MKIILISMFKFILWGVLGILSVGCASPRSILRMKPFQESAETQQIFWQNGTPYIQSVEDSIGVRVGYGFFDETQGLMFMNIECVNFSNRPILIAPEKFFYTTFDTTNNTPMLDNRSYMAINPEKKILDLEKGIARKEANIKNNQGWAIAGLAVAVTAVAVVAIAQQNNNTKSTQDRNNNRTSTINNNNNNNVSNAGQALAQVGLATTRISSNNAMRKAWEVQDDKALKSNWENLTLRKTHLFPQESIKGNILFPIKNPLFALRYLKFCFPIEQTNQKFTFYQKWIKSEIDAVNREEF